VGFRCDALHIGIDSYFDGGFGVVSTFVEIDKIADPHKLVPLLVGKGHTEVDIPVIIGANWLTKLRGLLLKAYEKQEHT
jgi:microsomal dipeptidase-like Zn-dependent dipeptidase